MTIREQVAEIDPELILLEPETFDAAILGVVEQAGGMHAVCYSREKCIQVLMKDNDWDRDDAEEFFEFNTAGAFVGEKTPMFLSILELSDD